MNEIVEVVNNGFTQLLIDFGCNIDHVPANQMELGVLWIQYSWAVFCCGLGIKSMLKVISVFVRGARC